LELCPQKISNFLCMHRVLQTAKINQGNIALKRVVESIANGDSHVPFRDSKLTMLLQVCFIAVVVIHGNSQNF